MHLYIVELFVPKQMHFERKSGIIFVSWNFFIYFFHFFLLRNLKGTLSFSLKCHLLPLLSNIQWCNRHISDLENTGAQNGSCSQAWLSGRLISRLGLESSAEPRELLEWPSLPSKWQAPLPEAVLCGYWIRGFKGKATGPSTLSLHLRLFFF